MKDRSRLNRNKKKQLEPFTATPVLICEEKPVLAKVPQSMDRFDSTKTNATAISLRELKSGTEMKGKSKKIKMAFPICDVFLSDSDSQDSEDENFTGA